MALQVGRVGEVNGVPGEITLPVRVLDVQPDDVIGDVVVIEPGVHGLHVSFVEVVPAALVVTEGKERGQGLVSFRERAWGEEERVRKLICFYRDDETDPGVRTRTCELSVLAEELLRTRPEQNHAVDHAALRQPVDVGLRLHTPPLHWGCVVVLGEVGGVMMSSSYMCMLKVKTAVSSVYLQVRGAVMYVHKSL